MQFSLTQRYASKRWSFAKQLFSVQLARFVRFLPVWFDIQWQRLQPALRVGRREPLLHFVVLGALIFVLDRVFMPAATEEQMIIVSPEIKAELADAFAENRGRAPDQKELQTLIQGWVQNEVLFREGLALGLDQGDPMIRERLIQKMHLVVRNSTVVPPPSEPELRRWFEARRDQYNEPARFDFLQIFVGEDQPGIESEAKRLRADLENAAVLPASAGNVRAYRRRTQASLVAMFGENFAAELQRQDAHSWRVLRSDQGWHVVRLEAVHPAKAADFTALRPQLEADWRRERYQKLAYETLQEMLESYEIRAEGGV